MEHIKLFENFRKNESDEFKSERSPFSDFKGRDLSIKRNDDGLLTFDFDAMGWLFDTQDVAEGAAIIEGSDYKKNPELRNIVITQKDKDNVVPEESIYWLTGGNKAWGRGAHELNVDWDDVADELVAKYKDFVNEAVKDSDTLGELIDELEKFDWEEYHLYMEQNGYIIDDEQE